MLLTDRYVCFQRKSRIGVSQNFREAFQICSGLKETGSEGMTKHVRRYMAYPGGFGNFCTDITYMPVRHFFSVHVKVVWYKKS